MGHNSSSPCSLFVLILYILLYMGWLQATTTTTIHCEKVFGQDLLRYVVNFFSKLMRKGF